MQESEQDLLRRQNRRGEFIYRNDADCRLALPVPEHRTRALYPWEEAYMGAHPRITREFFRCRGSALNPPFYQVEKDGKKVRYADCGGKESHSLPLRENKEYIYPILIELLNEIQAQTGKRIVITSGHRCPQHNSYVDISLSNRTSKHMLGAEVDFYVQGMEWQPQAILELIMNYFQKNPLYEGKKEYLVFERYEKEDLSLAVRPYYNKEIFIKLFQKDEGRNFDNRHPYPYLSIQVRYDKEQQQRVLYNWDLAVHNYLRW